MKTLAFVLLLSSAVAAPRADKITVDTSTMLPGQTQVFTLDGSVRVEVSRVGEQRNVRVERMGIVNVYELEPINGRLQVTLADTHQGLVVSPHRIVIDGVALDEVLLPQQPRRGRAYFYICPKDETMVRVPHSKFSGELKCPVDGTVMKPGLGQGSAIFLLQ
jgi:hypothetical protein